jgi:preprotein translocase subunit Sec63
MKRDDDGFMDRISRDLEARRTACQVLGVRDMASREELKKAYRRAAMKFHPDKNLNDPSAGRKFALVKCAYKLLAEDKSCEALLAEINSWPGGPEDENYHLDNLWGHFLWWREKFFGSL